MTHSHDYQPWAQYSEKQTSILTEVIEPETDFYPSVTVCAGERSNLLDVMDEKAPNWPTLDPENVSKFLEESDWNIKMEVK